MIHKDIHETSRIQAEEIIIEHEYKNKMFDFTDTKKLHLLKFFAMRNLRAIGKELKSLETLTLFFGELYYTYQERENGYKSPFEAYDMLPDNLVLKDFVVQMTEGFKLSKLILDWRPKAAEKTEVLFHGKYPSRIDIRQEIDNVTGVQTIQMNDQ